MVQLISDFKVNHILAHCSGRLCIMDRWTVSRSLSSHKIMLNAVHKKAKAFVQKTVQKTCKNFCSVTIWTEIITFFIAYFPGCLASRLFPIKPSLHILRSLLNQTCDRVAHKTELSKSNFFKIRSEKSCLWRRSNSRKKRREQKKEKKKGGGREKERNYECLSYSHLAWIRN